MEVVVEAWIEAEEGEGVHLWMGVGVQVGVEDLKGKGVARTTLSMGPGKLMVMVSYPGMMGNSRVGASETIVAAEVDSTWVWGEACRVGMVRNKKAITLDTVIELIAVMILGQFIQAMLMAMTPT